VDRHLGKYMGCMWHSRYNAVATRAVWWEQQLVQQEQQQIQTTARPVGQSRWWVRSRLLQRAQA
jgi:hypothetical protein